jgi:putative selenate reductase
MRINAHEPDLLPVARRAGFDLVELTLDEETARAEAARCLQCDTFCDKCVEVCPNRANYTYFVEPARWTLPVLACQNGELCVAGQESFRVEQRRQIVHVDDFCNECGNCATFCVHQGKPYADKPRLFLQQADFQLATGNAFYIQETANAVTIRRREGRAETRLTMQEGSFTFESAQIHLNLAPDFEIKKMMLKETFAGTFSLSKAVEMALILRGITTSLPFLLTSGAPS